MESSRYLLTAPVGGGGEVAGGAWAHPWGVGTLIPGGVRRQVFKAFLGLPFLKVGGRPRLNPGATGSGSLLQQAPYSEGESGKTGY